MGVRLVDVGQTILREGDAMSFIPSQLCGERLVYRSTDRLLGCVGKRKKSRPGHARGQASLVPNLVGS